MRRRIQRAHLLIHASRMEGGAHVIMEAVTSGTPVLASRIDGNVGMLGADYAGYFPWGDPHALAALILRCHESRSRRDGDDFLQILAAQCRQRAPLAKPAGSARNWCSADCGIHRGTTPRNARRASRSRSWCNWRA